MHSRRILALVAASALCGWAVPAQAQPGKTLPAAQAHVGPACRAGPGCSGSYAGPVRQTGPTLNAA